MLRLRMFPSFHVVFAWGLLLAPAFSDEPTQAVLDMALEPPTIITEPGPQYSDQQRDYAMTIGVDRTRKGRLWAAWVAGGDSDKGYFVAASSDDDGRTWSAPRLVIDPSEAPSGLRRRVLVGNFWTDPTGKLWLFFDQSMGYFDGRCGLWTITCADPDAETPQWSAPRRIADGCTLNKPTVLASGEWMLPVSLWSRAKIGPKDLKGLFPELDDQRMAHVYVSTDQGAAWTRRGGVVFPKHDFDEHMVVQRRDGSLWMLARTQESIYESLSRDGGKTWSEPKSALPNTNARFFIRRLSSGRLLLVKHGAAAERTAKRSHLTAFLSDDDGRTWQGGLVLDERPGVSYPDGFQAPDGRLFISYDWERAKQREILLAVFTEDDVLAGKPGASTRLRQRINKAVGGLPPEQAAAVQPALQPSALPPAPTTPRPDPVLPKPALSDPALEVVPSRAAGSSERWLGQAHEDGQFDRTVVAYDGQTPNKLVCDTTLRPLADGSWGLFLLAGDDFEPSPKNFIGLTRSNDQGRTWSALEKVETGFPREGKTSGQGPTELWTRDGRSTLIFSTHSQTWGRDWKTWFMTSDDSCRTWSKPVPAPGRLSDFTFLRNHIVARDGRIIVPFQHYLGPGPDVAPPPAEEKPWHKALRHYVSNPRNGVLISSDGGKTWTEHGNVRLTDDDRYHGWAENNIVELSDGRIAMIIRGDRLGGVLYYAESLDGGRTWPEFARKTDVPNPGSKATLYPLGGDAVALLHNPNPSHRSPLSLWISFDGLKTWPYRRMLVPESIDGPKGRLNYPDGFVSEDRRWLYFAFDDNRHNAVFYAAKLPPLEK